MLAQKTSSPTFLLAHMTHIDNVTSILRHGLLSHNHPHNHRDISNYEVNQRRSRTEPCYGRTLHEYVPLYLNPRNAMLYSCQKRFGEDVIILTVKPEALRNRSFVFSNMNAACSSAQFFTDVQELHTLEWHNVKATRWCDNGVYFPEVRQKMMAELLIYPDIPVQYLSSFTCQSQAVAERVKFALKRANLFIDININPDFFFYRGKHMITVKHGNIFTSKCQTIVNTINCVGQMGAGIALEFKLRYPNMYKRYQALCKAELIKVGSLWLYKPEGERYGFARVLNFPTKVHWRAPSRYSYLDAGLDKFIATYQAKGIESIAFPLLGASKGGLEVAAVEKLMQSKLSMCDIPVEIWHFDEQASDDLFDQFKVRLLANNVETVRELTGLRRDKIQLLMQAVEQPNIRRLSALAVLDGVGKGTLEKAFVLASGHEELNQSLSLF